MLARISIRGKLEASRRFGPLSKLRESLPVCGGFPTGSVPFTICRVSAWAGFLAKQLMAATRNSENSVPRVIVRVGKNGLVVIGHSRLAIPRIVAPTMSTRMIFIGTRASSSENGEPSAINRLIVAEEGVPVERRYSFPVGIFTREVKAPRSSSDLGKGQRRERDPHGHDTGYLTFPRPGQPRSRLGRGVRGYHSAPVPDLWAGFDRGSRSSAQTGSRCTP